MSEITLGEQRVRTTFNPSANGLVDQIKQKHAELINLVNDAPVNPEWNEDQIAEFKRLKDYSVSYLEGSSMYAVKAATL